MGPAQCEINVSGAEREDHAGFSAFGDTGLEQCRDVAKTPSYIAAHTKGKIDRKLSGVVKAYAVSRLPRCRWSPLPASLT